MQQNNDHENDIEIFDEMENPHSKAPKNEIDASYKILLFKGHIPDQFKSWVYATWLHSLRFGNDMVRVIPSDSYYKAYSKFIEAILNLPNVSIRIAVLTVDQDTALGWSICEGTLLHYVFVKPELRKQGIASNIVPHGIKLISHLTKIGYSIWNRKFPEYFKPLENNKNENQS